MEFRARDRRPVPGLFDPGLNQYIFEVPLEPVCPEWGLILGDLVYDTRASLDYLVTALIRSAGDEAGNRTQFPISGVYRAAEWREAEERWDEDVRGTIARDIKGTPPGTKEALKPLQPFYGVPTTDPWSHPLFILQTLSNRDKHRRLNLLVRQAEVVFIDDRGEPVFAGQPVHVRVADADGQDGYTLRLQVSRKFDHGLSLAPAYDVALDEPPRLIGNLLQTLSDIDRFIEARVVPAVTRLLDAR
jgi:hypothetical protein